jgi:hypothetical protein
MSLGTIIKSSSTYRNGYVMPALPHVLVLGQNHPLVLAICATQTIPPPPLVVAHATRNFENMYGIKKHRILIIIMHMK